MFGKQQTDESDQEEWEWPAWAWNLAINVPISRWEPETIYEINLLAEERDRWRATRDQATRHATRTHANQ